MRELHRIDYCFEDIAPENSLVAWSIRRSHARSILKCYKRYTGDKPRNSNFTAFGRRDRTIVAAEGMDVPNGLNVVGLLGVQLKRVRDRIWPTPSIDTFYISSRVNVELRNKIGSLLLNRSLGVRETREHYVAVSNLLDANIPACSYLRTHGFEGKLLPDSDQMGGLNGVSIGYGMQLKHDLNKYIEADLD